MTPATLSTAAATAAASTAASTAATAAASTAQDRFGPAPHCAANRGWPKHRILFFLAGTFTLTGTILAASVNRWFALLPGLVGANQLLLVATGWCPASALLDRVLPSAGDRESDGTPPHSAR